MAVRRERAVNRGSASAVDPWTRQRQLRVFAVRLGPGTHDPEYIMTSAAARYIDLCESMKTDLEFDPSERVRILEEELDRLGLRDDAERFITTIFGKAVA